MRNDVTNKLNCEMNMLKSYVLSLSEPPDHKYVTHKENWTRFQWPANLACLPLDHVRCLWIYWITCTFQGSKLFFEWGSDRELLRTTFNVCWGYHISNFHSLLLLLYVNLVFFPVSFSKLLLLLFSCFCSFFCCWRIHFLNFFLLHIVCSYHVLDVNFLYSHQFNQIYDLYV